MARLRSNYVFGTTDTALTAADTVLSSPALARLPVVAASDVAAVTVHDAAVGVHEIVHVTAHVAGATTATILRGQEGSAARAWPSGATWLHGMTAADLAPPVPDTWHVVGAEGEPPYENGWAPRFQLNPEFTQTSVGIVFMRGVAECPSTTPVEVGWTMPVGYRPSKDITYYTESNGQGSLVTVGPTGGVRLRIKVPAVGGLVRVDGSYLI